ncbi:MAG: serine/threonine protein kinase [Planctomycetota bacterium]|nr:MAG: serine/threonine protein kinase [Planctomycetota bacterium]
MDFQRTENQSSDEQSRAQALSLKPARPPVQLPGYELRRFLGSGAYGEVWVAIDRTTGRQVAIKFYAHGGGVDWSMLAREVEKLAFLSADRYVVQLLDVGWESQPRYYVMEYVEQGSLEDRLKREQTLPVRDAVTLFRDIAVGLLHAHGKGVLHCDLKPANILLDQDGRPRLADFGQSRLSSEQTPALGTLFYMAPEQADLEAVPDVQWDVYALGALLYCMLTGAPPYRTEAAVAQLDKMTNLEERLSRYRKLIEDAPPPAAHRQVPGVDRQLADIVDGCLASDRARRYANVQEVLDALRERQKQRSRRPLMALSLAGPALLLLVMAIFAGSWFSTAMDESDEVLRMRALESNSFAAKYVATSVTNKFEEYAGAVEDVAASYRFQTLLASTLDAPSIVEWRERMNDPELSDAEREALREQFVNDPARQPLQDRLNELLADPDEVHVESWFVTAAGGLQVARAPVGGTIGRNYGWRSYYHGDIEDHEPAWRPGESDHIQRTNLSAVYYSDVTHRWTVTISTPIYIDEPAPSGEAGGEALGRRFLGVLGVSADVGRFLDLPEASRQLFAVLVDWRDGPNKGLILQHPLFEKLRSAENEVPERFESYHIEEEELPAFGALSVRERYVDPLSRDPEGKDYDMHWLAEAAPVGMRDRDTGFVVIVQQSYEGAIGNTLERLRQRLFSTSLVAGAAIALATTILWWLMIRSFGRQRRSAAQTKAPVAAAK